MRGRKQLRTAGSDLTAGTGDETFQSEGVVASDVGIAPYDSQTSVQRPVVGRTPTDLLYDTTLSSAFGRFITAFDPLEVVATAAYVLLGIWGKGTGPPMSFLGFVGALGGYHVVLRPASELLFRLARGTPEPLRPPKPH